MALPKNSLVLVTGVNGFIGSHVADQALAAGFKVRGTVRSEGKADSLSTHFSKTYGDGAFSLAVVPDIANKEDMITALQGVDAIIHVAADIGLDPDPNKAITPMLKGVDSVLAAAGATPSIQRFIFTSSSVAVLPLKEFDAAEQPVIDHNSWNIAVIDQAWAPPPYEPAFVRASLNYAASKTMAERKLWDFVKSEKPSFIAAAVIPNVNFGPAVVPGESAGSTGAWIPGVFQGGNAGFGYLSTPNFCIDVRDTARLHVVALLEPASDITGSRLFGLAHELTKSKIVRTIQQVRPAHQLTEGEAVYEPKSWPEIANHGQADGLLMKHFGAGFRSLEDTVRDSIAGMD